ncbi:MAG: acyclic terpene utilization AtuA family protein, partial [Nocardioidaceae bacterium]
MSGVRIGNASGFYGDRLAAMREMLEGGELDYLTGDYLAELTMLILGRDRMKDETLGYAKTFARQLEDCLGLALDKGVRIVTNAGGLNPAGLAARLGEIATEQGLSASIAYVEGDDLRPRAEELGLGEGLTANAYLGAFGIAEALHGGADVVVTGRVTDASVIAGPAVAHHGWERTDFDALAGAVVAGHVIECGTQATGGNVAGFDALDLGSAAGRRFGFPVAEIAADGSSVITKHPGTGGAVTLDTVTAQIMYEIDAPAYLGPDVVAHLDALSLAPDGPDRVAITGVRGSAPPPEVKVCMNKLGGFRNSVDFLLTGLDIQAKADLVRAQLTDALAASPPDSIEWQLERTAGSDPQTQAEATALLRCHVRSASPDPVGRSFAGAAVELALGSYPGFALTRPPSSGTPYGVYSAAYVDQAVPEHTVVHSDGTRVPIPPPPKFGSVTH